MHLHTLSSTITNLDELKKNFERASVEAFDGMKELKTMVKDIETMMSSKLQAVQRLMETAEEAKKGHTYDPDLKYEYKNAKQINEDKAADSLKVVLTPNKHFENIPVNTSLSTIQVATNVYNEAPEVINDIYWSRFLEPTFVDNYKSDPTLKWQYFGSSTGFLRQFPGVKWLVKDSTPDTYDCRLRPWYIEAAASPKDIVILLDTSGSMTGLRIEIAKHVVMGLLDTLNHNDFVSVLKFADKTESVVECFQGTMVQANSENIKVIKDSLKGIKLENIANFTVSLIAAFDLLEQTQKLNEGSKCNKAIMLITDGAPYTFEEVFKVYNWPDCRVRVFTYLIGREVSDIRELSWMACANKGYYSHVTTLAEVPEQVQKYIPVMSRPMVLNQQNKTFIWTAVYADITDKPPFMVDGLQLHQLMTTVAAPVYDRDNVQLVKERIFENGTWIERTREDKTARLLGVVGTDVPVKEILKLAPSFKVGVNGYPFIITNNGYVLYHPDFRPFYDSSILKLDYTSVDLTEVEQSDSNITTEDGDAAVLSLRQEMIDRKTGNTTMAVKMHMDYMKRAITRVNRYYYAPLANTPFSFGLAVPEGYGQYRVKGEIDIKSADFDIKSLFEKKWKLHPDWVYCEYRYPEKHPQRNPEENLQHFLTLIQNLKNSKWKSYPRVKAPLSNQNNPDKSEYMEAMTGDSELVLSLIFDAKATIDFGKKSASLDENNAHIARQHGATVVFVATRSGLTRWADLLSEDELSNRTEPHFIQLHNRATDEIWYKRAVDHYMNSNQSFVFSVPFDAARRNNTYVTGTHAIFVEKNGRKAPAAVVGLQFKHSAFAETFLNFTSSCIAPTCATNCSSEDLDCYLLDDNGFVIVSEKYEHTGQFFGKVDSFIMLSMIKNGIYRSIRITDYQAVCEESDRLVNGASFATKPMQHIQSALSWLWGKIVLFFLQYNLYSWWNGDWMIASASGDPVDLLHKYIEQNEMTRKKMIPCDKQYTLYRLNSFMNMKPVKGKLSSCNQVGCDRPFSVQQVPKTNLLLLAIDALCPCDSPKTCTIDPIQVHYDNETECRKLKSTLYRKRPESCFSFHKDEKDIKDCGRGNLIRISLVLFFVSIVLSACDQIQYLWS